MTQQQVELILDDLEAVESHLQDAGELSLKVRAQSSHVRTCLIAAGACFEVEFCDIIETNCLKDCALHVRELVTRKAIKRQFHSYFDWDGGNLGPFRTCFGESFGAKLRELKSVEEYVSAEKSFLKVGRLRNLVAHTFSSSDVELTLDEVRSHFHDGIRFLKYVRQIFAELHDEKVKDRIG